MVSSNSCVKHSEMYLYFMFSCLRQATAKLLEVMARARLFSFVCFSHTINTQQWSTVCMDKTAVALTCDAKCDP